jgi:hypothetical protein
MCQARIAFTTNPTGTWTQKVLWETPWADWSEVKCIRYGGGYYVAVGYKDEYDAAVDGSVEKATIAYTTDINGTWTVKSLYTDEATSLFVDLVYADDTWVLLGQKGDYSEVRAHISYASTPEGLLIEQ